jgi:hypothetical protein
MHETDESPEDLREAYDNLLAVIDVLAAKQMSASPLEVDCIRACTIAYNQCRSAPGTEQSLYAQQYADCILNCPQ